MKKIRLYLISILVFIGLVMFQTKVNAAGTISLSSNKQSVTVGDEFSVSVNLSGASVATLTARVSVDTSKVEYVSGPSNSSFSSGRAIYTWTDPTGGSNPKTGGTIVTFKFRAKQIGKANFSVSGDFYSPDEKSINPSFSGTSVTINEKVTTPPPANGGGNNGGTSGGNGGNNNSGNTNGGNNGNTGGSSSSGNQSGTQNKPNTNNTNNLSKNANLKELHLDVQGLSPAFNKNTTNYSIVVGNNVSSININAIPEDSNAKVDVRGNTNLKSGVNKINIVVTAQDNKTTKTYVVNATKTENPDLANSELENLAIENVMLMPEFNKDIYEYTATIGSTVDVLNILAVPQIQGARVDIKGGDNISFGENIITITVTAKDGVNTKDYIVKVYKKTQEEEQNEINLINEQEELGNIQIEGSNNITFGDIAFITIILIGTGGAIFVLIRMYMKER